MLSKSGGIFPLPTPTPPADSILHALIPPPLLQMPRAARRAVSATAEGRRGLRRQQQPGRGGPRQERRVRPRARHALQDREGNCFNL